MTYLMDPMTGSVDTYENWEVDLKELTEYDDCFGMSIDQAIENGKLCEVEWDKEMWIWREVN